MEPICAEVNKVVIKIFISMRRRNNVVIERGAVENWATELWEIVQEVSGSCYLISHSTSVH